MPLGGSPGSGYNVVLVVFDTLRRDAVGCYEDPPPWGAVATPNLDRFARESVRFTRAYPESLPTLCARRALYTGQRTYPFHNGNMQLKGDFPWTAPGWGPIPEEQHTLSEILRDAGYRTGLISDLYHQFKPSKNFWRGFDQWSFIRGQETDPSRSGPLPTQEEIDHWVPRELQEARARHPIMAGRRDAATWFSSRILLNMRDRVREEQWFNAQVMLESGRWLEQNRDADRFFLTVESFDPHEPWFVPEHYRRAYDPSDGQDQVVSPYAELPDLSEPLVRRTRANYAGLVTMCDRWFGHLMESLRTQGWQENTVVVVTSDHGHTLWEKRGYIGKRGYPSDPEVYDVPLLIRHPEGAGAGTVCDAWVQHHDISATILEAAGVGPPEPVDGRSFWGTAFGGGEPLRDHVTVGWGPAMTVVTDRWWFNCKVDGRGAFLHDRTKADPFVENLAEQERGTVRELFEVGKADGGGTFPDYLLDLAASSVDAPGCSPFAAPVA
jgi:arylsulfatase A-like enzyme